jgi:hypothetical protein
MAKKQSNENQIQEEFPLVSKALVSGFNDFIYDLEAFYQDSLVSTLLLSTGIDEERVTTSYARGLNRDFKGLTPPAPPSRKLLQK